MYDIEDLMQRLSKQSNVELLSLCKTLLTDANQKELHINNLTSEVESARKQLKDPMVVHALTEIKTGEYGFWVDYKNKLDVVLGYIHERCNNCENECSTEICSLKEIKTILEA